MKPAGLFKNPIFLLVLVFLGIILFFVLSKRAFDEGYEGRKAVRQSAVTQANGPR